MLHQCAIIQREIGKDNIGELNEKKSNTSVLHLCLINIVQRATVPAEEKSIQLSLKYKAEIIVFFMALE